MRRLYALILVLAVGSAPAHAQPAAPSATEHFEAGRKAYDERDFPRAVAEWQQAYDLSHDPFYLFNIGQAHRQALEWEQALAAYERYLAESPKAKNKKLVQKRIREAKREIAIQPPKPTPPPEPPPVPEPTPVPPPVVADPGPMDPTPPSPTPPRPRAGRDLQLAGLISGGAGIALLVTGIVFSVSASSAREDLEDAAREGATWGPEFEDLDGRRKRDTALGAVGITLGVAAMGTGAILFLIGTRRNQPVEVQPAVGPGGAQITVRVRF